MVNNMKLEYICDHDSILKEYLKELNLSRRFLKKVKLYGVMMINNEVVKNFYPVKQGDLITLEYNENVNEEIVINNHELDIVYEDSHLLIINKEANLASQPSHKHFENNVVSMVKAHLANNHVETNVHVVNRLDYATSGLMVVAKDGFTHYELNKEKVITRKYYAIIHGIMKEKTGTIDLPIRRECEGSIKRIVASDGKRAITKYHVIKEDKEKNLSLVDVELLTGRTHQIRVHFSTLGYPLVGDALYGEEDERLYLHCYSVSFINPFTKEIINITKDPEFYNLI